MAKDPWHKGRISKIKNSPAANKLRGLKDSVMDAVLPLDGPRARYSGDHMRSRAEHFGWGATEHFKPGMNSGNAIVQIPVEYAEADQHFEDHGLGHGSEGNVTSIRRGIALKGERISRKPEGY